MSQKRTNGIRLTFHINRVQSLLKNFYEKYKWNLYKQDFTIYITIFKTLSLVSNFDNDSQANS